VKHEGVVSDVMNKFHVPHFSTEMVTEREMMERPFSLFLGPSKEDMTRAVETTVTAISRPESKVALINHQSSILLTSSLVAALQRERLDVIVEELVDKDIRHTLVRIRKMNIRTIIVDVAADLVKPFIYQVEGSLKWIRTYLFFNIRHYKLVFYRRGWSCSSQLW
jgi:hypothetical protein